MQLDARKVVPLSGIAHRPGNVRESAAELADEMLGAVAEAEDKEPHASPVQVKVPVRAGCAPVAHKRFLGPAKDIAILLGRQCGRWSP